MKKILVIEDNAEIRENLEEILELSDYKVITAINGALGIDLALQEQPQLILCDIAMPKKNGYEVLETLKDYLSNHNIPFVFLTASAEERDIAQGKAAGASAYFTKPFDMEKLLSTIGHLLSEKVT